MNEENIIQNFYFILFKLEPEPDLHTVSTPTVSGSATLYRKVFFVGCTTPGGPGPHRVRSPGGAGPVPAEKEGTAPPTAQSAPRGEHSKRYVSSTGVSLDGAKIQNYCLKIKLFKKLTSW